VLELEEHLKKLLAKPLNIRIQQELRGVLWTLWQLTPFDQVLHQFSIFLNCKPDSNEHKVLVIVILIARLRLLLYGVASAVNEFFAFLSQSVI
jgi:hypothetical protein